MKRCAAVVVLNTALLLGFAVSVHAQHGDRRNARSARPLFEAGREAYVAGRYREAAEAFERVFALTGHPFMLENLGNAYEKLGEREKAAAALHQYLRLMPKAEDREEIERRVAELDAPPPATPAPAVPEVQETKTVQAPKAAPAQARAVDPKPAAAAPAAIVATAERATDDADDVASVPAPPPAPRSSAAPSDRQTIDSGSGGLIAGRTFTWISLGAGVALATTAGVLWSSAHGEYDKLKQGCGAHGGCSDAQLDSVSNSVTLTNVTLGLSGVAFAAALVLFFIEGDDSGLDPREHARVEPSIDRHGAGLVWRGKL